MIAVLGLLICAMTASLVFGSSFNIVPGMSLKNLLFNGAIASLVLQSALGRPPKQELRIVTVCFAVLIVYAILTLCVVGSSGQLPRYSALGAVAQLKGNLVDWMLVFLVMFYGARSGADSDRLLGVLLVVVGLAQVITLWNVMGLPQIGRGVWNVDNPNRIDGFFGHANETGTMIATLLPAYVVAILQSRGPRKAGWIVLLGCSATILLATLSRGAIVALMIGSLWTALLCRNYLSFGRSIRYVLIATEVATPIVLAAGGGYVATLFDRFTRSSISSAADISSGRTIIWSNAFDVLSSNPVYLFTGVGYNTWSFSGMRVAPHNQYLSIYFELGVIGLITFLVLLASVAQTSLGILRKASVSGHATLIALVCSVLTLLVGMMFATLGFPWLFLWTYLALMSRKALNIRDRQSAGPAAGESVRRHAPLPTMLPARQPRRVANV